MVNRVNPLDEAELRLEFRRLYQEIGYDGMRQVLYELLMSAKICVDIMQEEDSKK